MQEGNGRPPLNGPERTLIRIGEKEWTGRARALVMNGVDFSLLATGWHARRLRDQLPRLANAARAVRQGTRFSYKDGNFSVLNVWLLFGFHGVYFMALGQGMFVSWTDTAGDLSIQFTRSRPNSGRVIEPSREGA